MKFVRLILASPFLFVGAIALLFGALIMGRERAQDLRDALKGISHR